MSVSEQVKELRELASIPDIDAGGLYDLNNKLYQAADTIEALSAKLQAENMERSVEDCGGGWILANVKNDNYICDYRLRDYYGVILITYETLKKKRYVKAVLCNYGHIYKKIGGEIIAWQFLPDSCKEENPYR